MADIVTPLILSSLLTISDYKSTQWYENNGYKIKDASPIVNTIGLKPTMAVKFAAIAGGDILVQKKFPKYKWHYRIGITVITAAAVGNNILRRPEGKK